ALGGEAAECPLPLLQTPSDRRNLSRLPDRPRLPETPRNRPQSPRTARQDPPRWRLRGARRPAGGGPVSHAYLSTACFHEQADDDPDLHGSCRATCKYCPARCSCPRHPVADDTPAASWVDQAREIAGALFAAIRPGDVPPALAERIADDPALFWLRGEVQPPGVWTPDPLEET